MKVDKKSMRLYAITDRSWLGNQSLVGQVTEAIEAGVTFLQLREKHTTFEEFVDLAKEMKEVTMKYQIPLIINDDIEVALECDADGVHVGQEDMVVSEARKRLGEDKIIGVSCQTVEQAIEAEKNGADYLGVGAVFCTSTKLDATNVSFDTLQAICKAVSIPVVAIGGIQKANMKELEGSGIAGVAVVSAIFAKKDITKATKELREKIDDILQDDSIVGVK